MAIISISKGAQSKGTEIAELTAKKLVYECVSREILLEASKQYDIDEIKLHQALESAPTVFSRMRGGKDKYVAYIENAFLQRMLAGNVVYHGFAGHFFVRDVSHAIKVRIIADFDARVQDHMQRLGVGLDEASKAVKKLDFERRSWAQALYGIDTNDPSIYDLVINVNRIDPVGAVDLILHAASMKQFQATEDSQRKMQNLATQAAAKAALVGEWEIGGVCLIDGNLQVNLKEDLMADDATVDDIKRRALEVNGIKGVEVTAGAIGPECRG